MPQYRVEVAWCRHWASHYGYSGPVTYGFTYRTLYSAGLLDWKFPCSESPNGHHTDAWSQGLEPCGACGEPLGKS